MFITNDNSITRNEKKEESVKPGYKNSEKFFIGCQAFSGVPIDEISNATGMSRAYIYQQKEKVEAYAASLDEPETAIKTITLTKTFIMRAIVILALYCRSPLEGIQSFFEYSLGINRSIGYISGVINDAARKAQVFDDNIRLDGVSQGANDEIFQGSTPVLTGIDAQSSYIYMLEQASDRKAETWEIYMEDRKDKGLDLKVSLNDGGVGLIAGIAKAFPNAAIQRDTFHALYEMGKEVSKAERKAYALIRSEYELFERLDGERPKEKTLNMLIDNAPKMEEAIRIYDTINTYYTWLTEILGFSGYSAIEATELATWTLNGIEKAAAGFPGLQKECEKTRKILPSLLSYIGRLETAMEERAQDLGIPCDAFHMMYRQLRFGANATEFQLIEYKLWGMLADKYGDARAEFSKLLNSIKKASSLVENLNGRIRDYMEIKRVVPENFFVLLKVYFNTRSYRRSRCPERIGKSPFELLTGEAQPDFLEALGY